MSANGRFAKLASRPKADHWPLDGRMLSIFSIDVTCQRLRKTTMLKEIIFVCVGLWWVVYGLYGLRKTGVARLGPLKADMATNRAGLLAMMFIYACVLFWVCVASVKIISVFSELVRL